MDAGKFMLLSIDEVELDRTNHRIRRFLEMYEGESTYEHIALALDVTSGSADDQEAGTHPPDRAHHIPCARALTPKVGARRPLTGPS